MPGWIKHTEETVYRIWDKWFESILERDNQESRGESFKSSLHWNLWKIVYYQTKVLGGVMLFGKAAGIRRFERMVGKANFVFGEGNWKNNMEKERET